MPLVLAWHKNTGPVTSTSVRQSKDRIWTSARFTHACGTGRRTSRKPALGQGSSPRRFWFRCQWPHHHNVSAGGRGRRRRAWAGQAHDPFWSQCRHTKNKAAVSGAGCVLHAGDWRRGTNGAEIWSYSFSQATHLVCPSTEGAFVQSVHSRGLLFLIYLPRGTPFSSVRLPAGGPLSNLHNGVLYVKGGCACDKPLLTLCSELEHGMSGGLLKESFTPGWAG